MNDEQTPYIQCHDLFKIYKLADLEVVALRGLDLEVMQGEFVAIVGASGSGKTTLLNTLAALDVPSAGQAVVGSRDLLNMTEKERVEFRRREVGFVWQSPSRNLLPYLTALENVRVPMAIVGVAVGKQQDRARELLSLVDLEEKATRLPHQLSGGEQQRVAIAVALANQPPLLLADEPTGELDSGTADQVLAALQGTCRTLGVTIIIVSHYSGVAHFADRVVQIRDGRIVAESVMEATYSQSGEMISEEYLVVDRAGRLQLPRESVEKLGLVGRTRLSEQQNGVVIRPREQKR